MRAILKKSYNIGKRSITGIQMNRLNLIIAWFNDESAGNNKNKRSVW